MAQDDDAYVDDFTLVDRPRSRPEAAAILHPGVAGSYGHVLEGSPLEQLRDGPEKEVLREQAMDSSANILQSVRKTVPIAKYQAPQQQEPQDPSIGFYEPPYVPENFPRDPVPQGGKGEGWPYAPQGWPKPDDRWGWRVGQRAAANSLWIDRYVTVPASLMKGIKPNSDEQFASKSRLVEYLKQTFPQMKDPYSIFKAFDWKVPAAKNFEAPEKRGPNVKRDKALLVDGDDNWQKSKKQCRAGNLHCPLAKTTDSGSEFLERLACNICCSEPGFCRECKCILCCKLFTPDADDFSIIRCLNHPLSEASSGPICGHAAHLDCALKSRLAGLIKKNGFYLEYMCRRCDRKTDLKETVSRLVSEFMSKTHTQSVESSLQLLLRVVQDPEDGESSKIQEILIAALKKVQVGADITESCKELTEELLTHLQLQSERSRARGRKRISEDLLQSYETSVDKRVARSKSVGSPDAQATENNNKSSSAIDTGQACSDETSPAVHRTNSTIVCKEFCGENGVTATSGTRFQTDLNMDEQSPSESLQNSLQPEYIVPSIPTDLLSCLPLLPTLLHESMCKSPTILIEDHIRECEAMTARVKGAGQLNSSPSIFSECIPGTREVISNSNSKAPSLTASSFTVIYHGNQELVNPVVEGPDGTRSPSAEKLIASIPSSSRAKSPSIFHSQDVDEHIANIGSIEVRKSSTVRPVTRSSSRPAKGLSLFDKGGADEHITNTGIIEAHKSSTVRPVTRSSSRPAKGLSLFDKEGADEHITNTGIIEAHKSPRIRPVTRSSSRRAKSPSLLDNGDADDHFASTGIIEAHKSPRIRPITRSCSRRAKSPSLSSSQDEGGDPTASTNMSEPSRKKLPTSSPGGIGPSLANSGDVGVDDFVVTQIMEVPTEAEPLRIAELPNFIPELETTDTAGFEAEFEDQINDVLEELKRKQGAEYACAEESLRAQKKIVIEQYQQLQRSYGWFAKNGSTQPIPHQFKKGQRKKPRAKCDRAMKRLVARYGKVQKEQKVFESMLAISNGFGQVSKEFLRDFFKWLPSDITEA